jgi:probable rRNA maturation factor
MTALTAAPAASPVVEVIIESARWAEQADAAATVRRAIDEAAGDCAGSQGREVAILLTDDEAIRALNRRWRGLDRPTNVLSFPAGGSSVANAGMLGDIAIAFETTAREAQEAGKPVLDHLAHLAVHGFLHLLGYDHQSDETADAMEGLERTILSRLGVPDPFVTRRVG